MNVMANVTARNIIGLRLIRVGARRGPILSGATCGGFAGSYVVIMRRVFPIQWQIELFNYTVAGGLSRAGCGSCV
jgi:hypothetical protein